MKMIKLKHRCLPARLHQKEIQRFLCAIFTITFGTVPEDGKIYPRQKKIKSTW